ncbi:hypothetical protein [Streptomyces sp. NPDC002209]|uniref:hypothetical protein n=1 Tax=Streptomyces sp. NPDC002209 TaxID=3364638 RepID=UPI00367C2657
MLYQLYLAAGAPSLNEIAGDIRDDETLPGAPGRDTVRRCISEPFLPPSQADLVSVAVVLARRAAWDEQDISARLRERWIAARMAEGAGRPVRDFEVDRIVLADLEVHPSLDRAGSSDRLGALPTYVPRDFDSLLNAEISAAADGQSRVVVLVGGSSTGKTRALWEAARKLPDTWRLWHPLSPTRPDAVLNGLADIAPRTVVWLNEAQHYLGPEPLGEQVAAGLRSLLHDPDRGPVLVLATLWPEHWDRLTSRTSSDRHARELLSGHKINVPNSFTHTELACLFTSASIDPRLAEAAQRSSDGQVTQYLAGVPVLMDRYEGAQGANRALIHAAMDARRLGAGPHLPLAWLADAALGYLTDTEWNSTSDDWLPQALDYVTRECNGIPGILTPVKAVAPRNQRPTGDGTSRGRSVRHTPGPQYQLADYLDQFGRRHRADQVPPIDFWTAAAGHAPGTDLFTLGAAAQARGLYRDAAQLFKRATLHGHYLAAPALVDLLHAQWPTDRHPAQWAIAQAPLDDWESVRVLLNSLVAAGARDEAIALATRTATQVVDSPVDHPRGMNRLLQILREAGASAEVSFLADRAATSAALDDPDTVAYLLHCLHEEETEEQATVLATRAATHTPLNEPQKVARLLNSLHEAEAKEQAASLAIRAATHTPLDNPEAVACLIDSLHKTGAKEQAASLATRAATHTPLDNPDALAWLLQFLDASGAKEQASDLAARAATRSPFDDLDALAALAHILWATGHKEQLSALATRAASQCPIDDPVEVTRLLALQRAAGDLAQAQHLATQAATHTPVDNPYEVARLLEALCRTGAKEPVSDLATRAATETSLASPLEVAWLLNSLHKVEAHAQINTLATRAAAHAPLVSGTFHLVSSLREAGAGKQAAALAIRAAAHLPFDCPREMARLLSILHSAEAGEGISALATRAAAHVPLDDPGGVAKLLDVMLAAGAREQVTTLATRAASHTPLHDLPATATLLEGLRMAGAKEQIITLATRAAAHAPLNNPTATTCLLDSLRDAGTEQQSTTLIARLPPAGDFSRFLSVGDHHERFRWGREPDGNPAPAWTWADLE